MRLLQSILGLTLIAPIAFAAPAQQVTFSQETTPTDAKQAPDDDSAQFELHTEIVLVNIVVNHGTDFAGGLTANDFQVFEDGQPQEITFFGAEETPFAAAILLDTSGSMENKLRLARVAAARFVDRTSPRDSIALYLFGSDIRKIQDFTPGGRDLSDGVWDTTPKGITKMYDGITQAVDALATRPEQRRAILLLSDGADFGSAASYDSVWKKALAAGVTVYTVDVAPIGGTSTLGNAEQLQARGILRGLAERSGGRSFVSKGGQELNDAFSKIIDEISHQYTIGYYPANSARDGTYRKIHVTTSRPNLKLRAKDGYQAPRA